MFETNKIYHGDCKEVMAIFPDDCIDLTVTSPPYDNLRSYKGYTFDFEVIAQQLFRVTKKGGVLVWVVGDSVIKGSESCVSFKQAIYFNSIGFNLHDTMIYQKDAMPFPESNRYNQCFEYMFVFSKGKPKTFNPIKDKTIWNKASNPSTRRQTDGTKKLSTGETGKDERTRFNIWQYGVGFNKSAKGKIPFKHPAIFPEKLANDHIISWSNKNDLVLDPFSGSGTTLKMARENHRRFVGIEISEEYIPIIENRIKTAELNLF